LHRTLKIHFAGSPHESVFYENFVDAAAAYDASEFPVNPVWDPLQCGEHAHRRAGRSIYCALISIVTRLTHILTIDIIPQRIKLYITLFMDMHIPLMNYMDRLHRQQNKRGRALIPAFAHLKPVQTGDMVDRYCLLNDDFLCTQINGQPPMAQQLQPSQALFGTHGIFYEGLLPDVLGEVMKCNFFQETKKADPLVHLIGKSIPQRCQVRNLVQIIKDYCTQHQYVYDFLLSCLKCSLLGLYQHATQRPPMKVRMALASVFSTKTKNEFLSWMMDGHQQLLFYVLKEFLVFACRLIPSLYEEITQVYNWKHFEVSVETVMDNVRRFRYFDPDDPMAFKGVESMFQTKNKAQQHNLYRPSKGTFAMAVMSECEKLDDTNCIDISTQILTPEDEELLHRLSVRVDAVPGIPFGLLECFKVPKSVISTISQIQTIYEEEGSKAQLKQFLSKRTRREFETIRTLASAYDRKDNVKIFTLPKHAYIYQCKALRRRYAIKDGEPLPDVGVCQLCLKCKTFKSFVNERDNKGKAINLYAYGNRKVLVDDSEGELTIKCGKRCDKTDGKKRHNYATSAPNLFQFQDMAVEDMKAKRHKKRMAKIKRKDFQNRLCAQTKLEQISLVGRVLQFYGKMYTICTCCGNFMTYSGKHFHGKKGFYCGDCLSEGGQLILSISCFYCHAVKHNESWTPLTVTDNGERKQIHLCKTCFKPWIRDSDVLLKLSTIQQGLLEKWKKLKHPSNV